MAGRLPNGVTRPAARHVTNHKVPQILTSPQSATRPATYTPPDGGHRGAGIHTTTSAFTTKATPTTAVHYASQASRSLDGALPRSDAQAKASCRGVRMCRSGICDLVLPTHDDTKSARRSRPVESACRRQRVRCSACIRLQIARRKDSRTCIMTIF